VAYLYEWIPFESSFVTDYFTQFPSR